MWSGSVKKFDNVKSPEQVERHFNANGPSGTTDLAGVLKKAFDEHFQYSGSPHTTILVITDGEPDSQSAAISEITKAANKVKSDEELSVSFIQIGNDASARKFLKKLDDELHCKYDIVDTLDFSKLFLDFFHPRFFLQEHFLARNFFLMANSFCS